jgi:hypothetical protein
VNFIYAHRPAARHLLNGAGSLPTDFGRLYVVSAESLIGLELQGCVNDARRTRDIEDMRSVLAANRETVDMGEIRGYFRLFGKEALPARDPFQSLDELVLVVEALCPVWPDRPTCEDSIHFLL